ncbi:MAG: DNA gyrase C-terminal beta-propeller domain-containing protein, partial [bacterium]|nr:DNA gyrase C-terminal beta-propeller domain-containing protein [bacterium]
TKDGYIKRLPPDTFKTQGRGGKGVIGLTTKEEDTVEHLLGTQTHDDLLFFTTRGRVFQLKAYDVPPASRTAKGQAIVNFLQLAPQEKITTIQRLVDLKKYAYLVMATKQGVIKKVDNKDFENVRRSGLIAIRLKEDDELRWVRPSTGKDEVVLITREGQAIHFKEKDVRPMGRVASGVRGIRLKKKDDEVVGMDVVASGKASANAELTVVMENGFGKRTKLDMYKVQGRGGSGVTTAKVTPKTGRVVSAFVLDLKALPEGLLGDLLAISEKGQVIRLPAKSVSVVGRATQGVRVMRFKEEGDKIASVTLV